MNYMTIKSFWNYKFKLKYNYKYEITHAKEYQLDLVLFDNEHFILNCNVIFSLSQFSDL